MSELLPRPMRCTGVATSYNLTMGLIGGTTPMVATYPIARTGDDLSPAICTGLSESAFRPLDSAPPG